MSPKRSQSHQRKIRSTYGSEGWGPIGDHTLCAVMNDLRVCARLAWPQTDRALVVTSGNALPRFTGGQVVQRLPKRLPQHRSICYQEAVGSQQVVGQMLGLSVITDPSITTTAGSESGGGDEDVIIVAGMSDLLLWESGPVARVYPEPKASSLTVVPVHSYVAFSAARYPQSTVVVSGLRAPQF